MEQAVERNYLMVRAMNSSEKEFDVFFKKNVVAVGWNDVDFSNFSEKSTDELISKVRQIYFQSEDTAPQVKGKRLNQIRRFHTIKKDDFIIVPYYNQIRLAKAAGESTYEISDKAVDLANQQKVEYFKPNNSFKTIPRNELSEALQRRLRMRGSIVTNLYEFKDEIEALFNSSTPYSWNAELGKREQQLKSAFKQQLKERICSGKNNLQAGGIGLEHLIKELFECEGYTAAILPKNKKLAGYDSDADISAVKSDKFQETNIFAQVKHHYGSSGDKGLTQLKSIRQNEQYKGYKFIFITSADVGDNIVKKAEDDDIQVLNGDELSDWIVEHMDKLSPDTINKLGISKIPQLI